jgi:hypothetical protein
MKTQILLLFVIFFFACNNKTTDETQIDLLHNIIVNDNLETVIKKIKIHYSVDNQINDTLFYSLYFYSVNDSNFLDISCDIGPTYFFSEYDDFTGFTKYESNYLIVISIAQNKISRCFINHDDLNKNIKQYEELSRDKYLSDGILFKFKIEGNYQLIPLNNLAKYLIKVE